MDKPTTVTEYIAELPEDRRVAIQTIRETILGSLDKTLEEGIQYGMVGYYVPHSVYPAGYHCDPKQPLPFASIASQKNHIGLYLFCVYTDPELQAWFIEAWKKSGKKLDRGKSCVRVKDLDGVPLDVLSKLFKRARVKAFIKAYEGNLPPAVKKKRAEAARRKKTP